jgi:hypothetical protein
MVTSLRILSEKHEIWRVATRWRGRSLAVHAPVAAGVCSRCDRQWTITHIASGFKAGTFQGSMTSAIKLAKAWDSQFTSVTAENAPQFSHKELWISCLRNGVVVKP